MKIAVAGTGYVGLSLATLLSQNNEVVLLDIVKEKVDKINHRISPIKDNEIEDFFKNKDLNNLIANLKDLKINEIYIDDSVFDKTPYPTTWLDEDKWPNQGMITPYIIDNNTVKIAINRSSLAKKVDIIQEDEYKIPFINELKIGEKQDIKIARLYGQMQKFMV